MPLMRFILRNSSINLISLTLRHHELSNDEVLLRHCGTVAIRERIFETALEGSPYVDETVAFLEEGIRFGGLDAADDAFDARGSRVDVDFVEGASYGETVWVWV